MSSKVLIAGDIHDCLSEKLRDKGYELVYLNDLKQSFVNGIAEFEGIITSNKLELNRDVLTHASNLKWIGRLGSGMDIIDVAYANSKGIKCYSSPEGNANAVAEQALGTLLSLQHNIFKAHMDVIDRKWLRNENRGIEIDGQTAGIIGLGNNGLSLAKKLTAMGMKVLAYDKYKSNADEADIVNCPSLDLIHEEAHVVSFHVPLTRETIHYFDTDFLARMQNNFILLNLSRGPVVSLKALHSGMQSGKITAAALDVWEKEPYWEMEEELVRMADELMTLPNFIGTPHIGGYTVNAVYKMSKYLAEKIFKD